MCIRTSFEKPAKPICLPDAIVRERPHSGRLERAATRNGGVQCAVRRKRLLVSPDEGSRYVMHLVHRNTDDRWHLQHLGRSIFAFDTKEQAIDAGQTRGHHLSEVGTNAQLVIHRQDGSIENEFIYGEDPHQIPG
jgi:hypothetical protein